MPSPFPVCRWFDILLNRLSKRLPLVVHLNRRIIKGDIFPLISLANPDILFTMLAEPQCAIGANHLAAKIWRAISESNRHGNPGESVLVSNKSGCRVITWLVVCTCTDRRRDRCRLRRHHPGEAVYHMHTVGQPHARRRGSDCGTGDDVPNSPNFWTYSTLL